MPDSPNHRHGSLKNDNDLLLTENSKLKEENSTLLKRNEVLEKENESLHSQVRALIKEKQDMAESFQITSGILLQRISEGRESTSRSSENPDLFNNHPDLPSHAPLMYSGILPRSGRPGTSGTTRPGSTASLRPGTANIRIAPEQIQQRQWELMKLRRAKDLGETDEEDEFCKKDGEEIRFFNESKELYTDGIRTTSRITTGTTADMIKLSSEDNDQYSVSSFSNHEISSSGESSSSSDEGTGENSRKKTKKKKLRHASSKGQQLREQLSVSDKDLLVHLAREGDCKGLESMFNYLVSKLSESIDENGGDEYGGSPEDFANSATQQVINVQCSSTGDSLLHGCIQADRTKQQEILNLTLGYGIRIELTNNHGVTPLHLAIQRNSLSMVRGLVELGADYNKPIRSSGESNLDIPFLNYTPVMLACIDVKQLRICRYLVESKADTTGAMEAAQKGKCFQTLVYLASAGAKMTSIENQTEKKCSSNDTGKKSPSDRKLGSITKTGSSSSSPLNID